MTVKPGHDRGQLPHHFAAVSKRELGPIVGRHTDFGKQRTREEAVRRAGIDERVDG